MAFTEAQRNEILEIIKGNSTTVSKLDPIVGEDGKIWVLGTKTIEGKDGEEDRHESVRIDLSDLKGQSGANSAGVSVYTLSKTQPEIPKGNILPPEGWQLELDEREGIWWESRATFTVDADNKYDKMIGTWSVPIRFTVKDGTVTLTHRRYCSSESPTEIRIGDKRIKPWIEDDFDWNNPDGPGEWWKEKRKLVGTVDEEGKPTEPNIDEDYIKDPAEPAQYNTDANPPIYLWETTATILNGVDMIEEWSDPVMISAYAGDKGETPELIPVFNIEASSQLMICDPETSKALSDQIITITAKLQNFKELSNGDIVFKMIPYGIDNQSLGEEIILDDNSDTDNPIATLTNADWAVEYAKAEIVCTIKNKSATTTIHRHTNAMHGDNVVFSYLTPDSVNLVANKDGVILEDNYKDFNGQLVLLDGSTTIIDSVTNNKDVEFEFDSNTPGLVIAIVENGKWKSNDSENDINGTEGEEGDGVFKILDYSQGSDNMRITIWTKYRGFRRPSVFSIYKSRENDNEGDDSIQNTSTREIMFALTRGNIKPTITINPDYLKGNIYQTDGFTPKVSSVGGVVYNPTTITWHSEPQNVTATYNHQWRSDRVKTNGVWGAFQAPYLWTNYSKPPEIDPNSRLQVYLENGFEVFNGVSGSYANIFVRAYLDAIPQEATRIIVGKPNDVDIPYDDVFDYAIDSNTQRITFTLNKNISDYRVGKIPIKITVNNMDFVDYFGYIIGPRGEDGQTYIMKLTTTSSTFTRDLTDTSDYKKDSEPKEIIVTGHHDNVDNPKWFFQRDREGEYTQTVPSGVIIDDNVVTITTAALKISNTLNIKFSGTASPGGFELYDVISLNVVHHGRTGIPGKTPFTMEWKEGITHRNDMDYVDYVYFRRPIKEGLLNRNGWFKLTDNFEYYEAPSSPYDDDIHTDSVLMRQDGGKNIYEKIDNLGTKAFEVIIGEEGNLAGFVFKNNKLYSQDILRISGKDTPRIMLNGVDGKIIATDVDIMGNIIATSGNIGNFTVKDGYLIGYKDEDLIKATVGLNANQGMNKDNIAFWAGGSLSEVYDYSVNRPQGEDPEGKKSIAYIGHDGKVFFSDADIQGKITASSGTIGGFTVGKRYLRGYNKDGKATVGLNANTIESSHIAFWAGTVIDGGDPDVENNLDVRAIIRHDGSSKFSNAVIEGDITATTGTIGGFNVDDNYLRGYKGHGVFSDENVTVGLNAKAGTGQQNIAFWSGGTLGEAFSAKDKMFDTEPPKMAYITHKGEAFFSDATIVGDVTATSGKIGGFRIDSSYLKAYSKVGSGGEYGEADVTMGLNAKPVSNNTFLPAFWAGGTYEEAVEGEAKTIIKHDGKAIFTDAEIKGKIVATSGVFKGSLASPFQKLYSNTSYDEEFSNNLVVTGMFSLPWNQLGSGRHIRLIQPSTGNISCSAPSGFFFYEDGEKKSKLNMTGAEIIELLGYTNSNGTFVGWLVLNRGLMNTLNTWGEPHRIVAQGYFRSPSYAKYHAFDSSALGFVYNGTSTNRYVTITMPDKWFDDKDGYYVKIIGNNGLTTAISVVDKTSSNKFDVKQISIVNGNNLTPNALLDFYFEIYSAGWFIPKSGVGWEPEY